MREATVENRLIKRAKELGAWALKFLPFSVAGMPDRIVLFPGGHIVFVELKRPGEKPRPLQLKRKSQLEKLGFEVQVLYSLDTVDLFMKKKAIEYDL